MDETILKQCTGFDWDGGNHSKNWLKHGVRYTECEEVFFNEPLLLTDDLAHSHLESRYFALGQSNQERKLLLVFTIRNNLVRVISARDMNQKERRIYETAASHPSV